MKTKTPRQINAKRKKEGKPPLNFALFRKVIKKLETAPEAYEQTVYATRSGDAPCGTAACIAGWATVLSGNVRHTQIRELNMRASGIGSLALGITDEESSTLFDGDPSWSWPERFGKAWARTESRKQQARIAVRYLTHIIKTGKVTE